MVKNEQVWASPAKNALGVPYLSVHTNGRFYWSERAGVNSVAFVLGRENQDGVREFGIFNEPKPPITPDGASETVFVPTAFGGSLDSEKTPFEIVKAEVKEEAGYSVLDENIHDLGVALLSSQMSQRVHLYFIEVTEEQFTGRDPQTAGEASANVVWLESIEDIINIDCCKAQAILLRASLKDL